MSDSNSVPVPTESTALIQSGSGPDLKDEGDHNASSSSGFSLLKPGGLASSGFNLASATLGAGTLSLPSAMNHCGILFGALFLIIICASTVYTLRLLIHVLERTGHSTYEQMAKNLVGPKFEKLTAFLIVAFCWGITIVYIVAMGDILEPLQTLSGWPSALSGVWGRRLITAIFWACFMLPLSLAREINSLRFASVIGVLSSAFLTFAIAFHSLQNENAASNLKLVKIDTKMLMAMPICTFAYCCQTNAFEIYSEMRPRSKNRMTVAAAVSMTLCTCIYILAGASGAADFGDKTEGDILKNYEPTKSVYLACAFVAITFTLTMAFPICIFPTRDAILQMMHYKDAYSTPTRLRIAVSATLAVLSLIVGLFTPGIQVLFGLLGGICGSTLAFIWPAIFVLRAGGWTREKVGLTNVIAVWALIVGGCFAGVVGTISSLVDTIDG